MGAGRATREEDGERDVEDGGWQSTKGKRQDERNRSQNGSRNRTAAPIEENQPHRTSQTPLNPQININMQRAPANRTQLLGCRHTDALNLQHKLSYSKSSPRPAPPESKKNAKQRPERMNQSREQAALENVSGHG
jgi:hypothetical protein